jgi:hypothetical protein
LAKYARNPRQASLHCNRGRLRTLFPRYHTTKTRRRPCCRFALAVRVEHHSHAIPAGQCPELHSCNEVISTYVQIRSEALSFAQSSYYRYRGSLQFPLSEKTAGSRSLPQILLPALWGCSRKYAFRSVKCRSMAALAACIDA